MDSTRRSVWRQLLLSATACAVASLLGKLLCRVLLPVPQMVRVAADPEGPAAGTDLDPAEFVFGRNPEQSGLYVNTSAGRRLRPNTHVRIRKHYLSRREIKIRTNTRGYRNREIQSNNETTRPVSRGLDHLRRLPARRRNLCPPG